MASPLPGLDVEMVFRLREAISRRECRMLEVRRVARELRKVMIAMGQWDDARFKDWREGYRRNMREARDW